MLSPEHLSCDSSPVSSRVHIYVRAKEVFEAHCRAIADVIVGRGSRLSLRELIEKLLRVVSVAIYKNLLLSSTLVRRLQ